MAMKDKPNWEMKIWRVPQLDKFELLHLKSESYEYPPHMHEEYSIVLILDGSETTTCRGRSHTAFAGDLLCINADELHSSKSNAVEYRVMKLKGKTIAEIASGLYARGPERPSFPELIIKDRKLFRTLLSLHLELEHEASFLEQESRFISAISLLLARTIRPHGSVPRSGQERRYAEIARDYLKSHYTENVSLADLTSITNLSPFHLLRVFSRRVGCPPHEFQTQLRIAHARKLLREGRPISGVALETGFFDQSHFSRHFKRIVGIPPGLYSSQSKIVQDKAGLAG
jgi:AraC-like DNA-binding protein